jgi:predicted MFS family arabinose efflux permease
LLAIGAGCLALAAVTAATLSRRPPAGVARLGYLAAFRAVAAAPGALALILGSTARAGVWMAYLAYLAAYLADRFAASTVTLGWIWTLGGSTFFLANIAGGRIANRDVSVAATPAADPRGRHVSAERLLEASLLVVLLTASAYYLVASWSLALLLLVLLTAAQGISLAALVSLLIRRYPAMRGAVMGLNAAGFNLGTFGGVGLAGLGLGVAGYRGLAAVLACLGLLALGTTARAVRCPLG